MKSEGCPVCGDPNIDVLDEHGCTTFEICCTCRCQAGYQYDEAATQAHLFSLRKEWLETTPEKVRWLGGRPAQEVDPVHERKKKVEQLLKAGLEIPD